MEPLTCRSALTPDGIVTDLSDTQQGYRQLKDWLPYKKPPLFGGQYCGGRLMASELSLYEAFVGYSGGAVVEAVSQGSDWGLSASLPVKSRWSSTSQGRPVTV